MFMDDQYVNELIIIINLQTLTKELKDCQLAIELNLTPNAINL